MKSRLRVIWHDTGGPSCQAMAVISVMLALPVGAQDLEPLRYQNPGLTVDLGVGLYAWPLPMDFDNDGDLDLVVSCSDTPYNGTYVFENPGGSLTRPVFKPARRISEGRYNTQISWFNGEPRVLTPAAEYPDFLNSGLANPRPLAFDRDIHRPIGPHSKKLRSNHWKWIDFDGDGDHDLYVGIGDWSDYGWDDAFNAEGQWTHGPLHGFVYWIANVGSDSAPVFAEPHQLQADGRPIDTYGWPSPNLADFDGDGDLDLLCGEFLDQFTYFRNVGSRPAPRFESGVRLTSGDKPLRMDLQMILPVAIDWDRDGDVDLVVGDEDGRVALIEHRGNATDGTPEFALPFYFQQEADWVKCGALSTPCVIDWDGDGDEDILSGNTAGYIEWFENLGHDNGVETALPRWANPRKLRANDQVIRIQAGPNGSIQGPCEAKWGYTTLTAGDWDHDGLPDLIVNSIWGKVQWYRNVGTRTAPRLAAAADVEVEWNGAPPKPEWTWWNPQAKQLVTQWRTTPVMVDWNRDGFMDLVMLDHEGYLTLWRRESSGNQLRLRPPKRAFVSTDGNPLRLNSRRAGASGRRKLAVVDWDQDGKLDVLVDGRNADWYRQIDSNDDRIVLEARGSLADRMLSSHTTSPTTVDWNSNGVPDLLVGAEDGHFYYLPR